MVKLKVVLIGGALLCALIGLTLFEYFKGYGRRMEFEAYLNRFEYGLISSWRRAKFSTANLTLGTRIARRNSR